MKKLLLSVLAIIFLNSLFSQRLFPIWSDYSMNNYLEREQDQLQFDAVENLYVLNQNSKVKKLNSISGVEMLEIILMGDTIIEKPLMVIDSSGNVITAGFQKTSSNGTDMVVAKYSSNGTRLWYQTYNGTANGDDEVSGLDVDKNGNIYITGNSNTNTLNSDVITQKYDSSGSLIWTATYNGLTNLTDLSRDIKVNEFGEVFIVGKTLDYLSNEPFSSNPTDSSYKSFFIKYGILGNLVFNKKSTTRILGTYVGPGLSGNFHRNDDVAYNLKIENGNVFVASDLFVGSTTEQYQWIGQYSNEYEAKIAKYSYSGSNLGTLSFSNSACTNTSFDREKIEDFLVDSSDHIYVKRRCNSNRLLEKYSPTNTQVYSKSFSKSYDDLEIVLHKNNLYSVVAKVTYQAWVSSMFINKYDSLGGSISNFSNYTGGTWFVYDLIVDEAEDVYISAEQGQLSKYCGSFPSIKTINDTVICFGDSVELTSSSNASSFSWNYPSSLSTDTLLSPKASPKTSRNYILTASYESGCSSKDTVRVEVYSKEFQFDLCNNDSVIVRGKVYKDEGTYFDTIMNPMGCDSIIVINIFTGNDSVYAVSQNLCNGDSILFNGNQIKTAGIYSDTLQSYVGCDSVVNLTVSIIPSYFFEDTLTICHGDSALIFGAFRKTQGVYENTFQAMEGCDSIYRTRLNVNPNYKINDIVTSCNSYLWPYNNVTYNSSGFYTDTLSTRNGCDSIFNLTLVLNSTKRDTLFINSCNTYFWNETGQTYNQSGVYSDTLSSTGNCDSIISINLTLFLSSSATSTILACDSYTWSQNSTTYTNTGIYKDTLQSTTGCDSILILDLTINNSTNSIITATSCNNYTWTNGTTYNQSGTYFDTITNTIGCDSTLRLDLSILPDDNDTITTTSCGSFSWGRTGNTYFASGTYYDIQTNSNGCDSSGVLYLTITPTFNADAGVSSTICEGVSVSLGGSPTGPSGSTYSWSNSFGTFNSASSNPIVSPTVTTKYFVTVTNTNSCTSIDSVIVVVNPLPSANAGPDQFICNSQSVGIGGSPTSSSIASAFNWSNAGSLNNSTVANPLSSPINTTTYTVTVTDFHGCTNSDQMTVFVNSHTTSTINITTCNSYFWSQNSTVYNNSGSYIDTIQNSNGCDSIVTLNLTINSYNTGVTQNGFTLTSNQIGGNYQWFDCSNGFSPIPGAVNRSYTATSNGDYSVEVGMSNCIDTSGCYTILGVGIEKVESSLKFNVYPNPTSGFVTLECGTSLLNETLSVYNINGKKIHEEQISSNGIKIDLRRFSKGIYYISILDIRKKIILK